MSDNTMSQEGLFQALSKAVVEFNEDRVRALAHQAIEYQYSAEEAIHKGLSLGMARVGEKFEDGEYFIPELLMSAKALMKGVEILKPHLSGSQNYEKGVVVIGTVKGDIHSIGKDIVSIMMEASGFEVHNLGINIDHQVFVEKAEQYRANIIGLSALMSSTMNHMKDVIDLFKQEKLREKYLIMVGGAPVSQKWCEILGADGFAPSAVEAVEVARRLFNQKQERLDKKTV